MLKLPISEAELRLTYLIASKWSHTNLDKFMIFVSNPYRWLMPTLIFAMILIYLDWQAAILALLLGGVSASFADGINSRLLKKNTDRVRPGKQFEEIRSLGSMNHGKKSFPSNHASNTMSFALAFSFIFLWTTWILIPLSLLVGYSRIYCGAHFPLDVVAGWMHGAVWTLILFNILKLLL